MLFITSSFCISLKMIYLSIENMFELLLKIYYLFKHFKKNLIIFLTVEVNEKSFLIAIIKNSGIFEFILCSLVHIHINKTIKVIFK